MIYTWLALVYGLLSLVVAFNLGFNPIVVSTGMFTLTLIVLKTWYISQYTPYEGGHFLVWRLRELIENMRNSSNQYVKHITTGLGLALIPIVFTWFAAFRQIPDRGADIVWTAPIVMIMVDIIGDWLRQIRSYPDETELA